MLAVARGDEPADLLIKGGRVFVPGTREWVSTDLAVVDGVIAGWGPRDAAQVVDVAGAALTAGFIDPHMHLESTKLWVDEFVRTVMPHGTTAVAADPHEIANVFGVDGVVALADAARGLPFTFGICASSCVPASPFESPAAELDHADLAELLEHHGAIGIAEVMDFPGVIRGDAEVLAKIAAAGHRRVDGHAPASVAGRSTPTSPPGWSPTTSAPTLDEADEKRRKGMWMFIREGSASRNLADLVPSVLAHGTDRVCLCTDDREPDTLLHDGHINDCVRLAVAAGLPVEEALVLATANPADYHRFDRLGWLAPGYQADVLCFDDLASFEPARVWQAGKLVAVDGQILPGAVPAAPAPEWMFHSVHLDELPGPAAFEFAEPSGGQGPGDRRGVRARSRRGTSSWTSPTRPRTSHVSPPSSVTGTPGGSGSAMSPGSASRGARSPRPWPTTPTTAWSWGRGTPPVRPRWPPPWRRLVEIGGGQVAMLDGHVIGEVRLPIGGLMSDKDAVETAREVKVLAEVVSTRLGLTLDAPFMQLSFLGLTVIPELRMTDRGLLDVSTFSIVDVAAG